MYWLRKRVPRDLIAVLGKREVKRSLGTRDPGEAKRRHAEELTKLEKRWEELRSARLQPYERSRRRCELISRTGHPREGQGALSANV
ncbi:MAG: DUF6538 domain-containing protein [Microvirga sp.]